MSVRIGHASIDENGSTKNGKAGDQTGKEVCVRSWYSKPWEFVLRCKDSNIANEMADVCEKGCNNPHIGYDQNQRNSLRTQAKSVNYDLSKIVVDCECDCSSFMSVIAECGGIPIQYNGTNAPTTRTMKSAFLQTGLFECITDQEYLTTDKYLKRGDILVKSGSHTVMVLDNGESGANTSKNALKTIYGIDVSSCQGNINFGQIRADGVQFVILRSTTKNNQPDTKWYEFLKGCDDNNLKVDCYKYSYATTEAMAIAEAESVIRLLDGRKMTIWYDVENTQQINAIGKSGLTKIISAFAKKCMDYGYEIGIYCNLNWWNVYIEDSIKQSFPFWIARYGKNTGKMDIAYKPNKGEVGWQYSSVGKVNGISGNVDMDVMYVEADEVNNTYSGKITANVLNIRKGASTSYAIVGTYVKGTVVTILEESNGWGRTNKGWISLKYVNKI